MSAKKRDTVKTTETFFLGGGGGKLFADLCFSLGVFESNPAKSEGQQYVHV